ncbi:hypothetical protein ABH14_03200 [Brevibacillus brevis]|uniref:hypothetical protein n=1 Tax=Brevibacillus brevis TaxID=1393 RepID=UPI001900CFBC|nr:hypothetical protein [Brevibacillus brevis]MBH0328809.1 hypothetical protein [Brevibacillus brevis]
MNFQSLSDSDLISSYGDVIKELKNRKIIRSKNVVGDLGEYLAIEYYNRTPGLPKLQFAPPGTKNIDAISINGERYSIKSTSSTTTGVFYGLNQPNSNEIEQQKFEYVIIVVLDENFTLTRINELTWEQFLEYKRWHSRMSAWNLTINKKLLEHTRTIYKR